MQPVPPMKETVDLRFYATVLWRRKWIVLIPAVLAAVTSAVVTLPRIMKPVYQSSSTLMVEFPQALSKGLASLVDAPSMEEQIARLQTQIQSNEFLTRVIANTGLREDTSVQSWARKNQRRYPDLSQNELVDLRLIQYLRNIVRTTGASRSKGAGQGNLIQVSVADYYPARARRLVQNITAGIIEANRGEELRQAKSAGEFSAVQVQEYDVKLKDAEDRLERFRQQQAQRSAQPTLVVGANLGLARELRGRAALDLDRAGTERSAAAESLRGVGFEAQLLDRLLTGRGVAVLLEGARALERDYVEQTLLAASGGGGGGQATAIAVARKQDQIAAVMEDTLRGRGDLPAAARTYGVSYLRALVSAELSRTRLNAYDGQLAEYTNRLGAIPQADLEMQRLQEEVDSYRALKNTFITQVTSSRVSEAYGSSQMGEKISVLEPAQHPLKPIRPMRGRIILLSIIAGLGLGMAGAFVFEQHDQTLRDVKDAERQMGLRVIGTIPNLERLARLSSSGARRGEAALHAAAMERSVRDFLNDSPGYQEFRKLVLALLRLEEQGPKSIMVTSARRGEGKTTTSACLALALAKELPQERVILVDLDVRKAALGAFFGVNGDSVHGGVYLREQRWEGDPTREMLLPNLRLLPVELCEEGVEEQITTDSIRWLLQQLQGRADRIVIDSPPNLPVPDPLIIGSEVDGVLIVVRAGVTPRETARRGVDLQRQFRDNLVGLIVNNEAQVLPYYYSPRHYGYGYNRRG
jgi:polysaccharide biosynthesis transport protein